MQPTRTPLSFAGLFLLIGFASAWNYQHSQELIVGGGYLLRWNVSEDGTEVAFGAYVKDAGFIGLGFGSTMCGSDGVIGYLGEDGIPQIQGHYLNCSSRNIPGIIADVTQDVKGDYYLLNGTVEVEDGVTSIHFRRLLNTGHAGDAIINITTPYNLIFSAGSQSEISFHDMYFGIASVLLQPPVFDHVQEIAPGYMVEWMVEGSGPDAELTIQASYNTTGWLGFGFNAGRGMCGSDGIIGWSNVAQSSIAAHYLNCSSGTLSGIAADISKDVKPDEYLSLAMVAEDSGRTTMLFRRKLITGYSTDVNITTTPGEGTPVIWAAGTTDTLAYHGSRRGEAVIVFQPTMVQTEKEGKVVFA